MFLKKYKYIMKYRYLNEVLLNWGNSEENTQDIIKASDIKKKIERKFIYHIPERFHEDTLRIFDDDWPLFDEYKNRVYLNGQRLELKDNGHTASVYPSGDYEIYIENFEKIDICRYMFCVTNLAACPLWDTSKVSDFCSMLSETFCEELPPFNLSSAKDISYMCSDSCWETIPMLDVTNVTNMKSMFSGCLYLKTVPMFKGINPTKQFLDGIFYDCQELDSKTKKAWGTVYDFETNKMRK